MSGNHGSYESYTYSSSSAYTKINGKEEAKAFTSEKHDKNGVINEKKIEEHLKPNGEIDVKETINDGKTSNTNQYTLLSEDKPKELTH